MVFKFFWRPCSLLWLFKQPVLNSKTCPQFLKSCSAPLRIYRTEYYNYGAESTYCLDTKRSAAFIPCPEAERRIFKENVVSQSGTPHFFRVTKRSAAFFCFTKRNAAFFPCFKAERRIFSVFSKCVLFCAVIAALRSVTMKQSAAQF